MSELVKKKYIFFRKAEAASEQYYRVDRILPQICTASTFKCTFAVIYGMLSI